MASYSSHPGKRPASPPEVERPPSYIWRQLEAESVRWEGQVLIVGEVQDLPARLVITRQRLALIANRSITLEMPREWLRPAPELTAENGVRLSIDPDASGKPDSMILRVRDGRGAAAELVAVITGRPLPVEHSPNQVQIPNWKDKVGAAPSLALPPLDENEDARVPESQAAAWPPQELEGVAPRTPPRARQRREPIERPRREAPVAIWAASNLQEPTPVPSSVSRAARTQGTQADGFTVTETTAAAAPAPITAHRVDRSRGSHAAAWVFRAAIVLLLLGTIGYAGRDRFDMTFDDLRSRIPADVQDRLGIADDTSDVAMNTAPEGVDVASDGEDGNQSEDGTDGPPSDNPTEGADAAEPTTAVRRGGDSTLNVGGTTTELPPTSETGEAPNDPAAGQVPVETETPVPTEEPVAPTEAPVVPTEAPVVPTEEPVVPTEVPAEAPEPTATAIPTEEPTVAPTEEPIVEPTAAPTEEPTAEPTVESTPVPTEESTPEATAGPTEEPVEDPAETPEPTREPQAPSVEPDTTPEQAIVSEGFRYTIEGASRGETVPELAEINSVGGYGEWVVLSVYGQNMSESAQVFDMSDFRLYADGEEVLVDVGNGWVNSLAGNTPSYGNTDAIQWAPGEGHRFILTFLAPPAAESLILQAGDQAIDLTPALTDPAPLLGDGEAPAESDLLQGTVIEVIDAETILVEIDGVQQSVRYLGVDVPTGDDCYAAEATAVNSNLVARQTVTIERQATDVDARGNRVRDVWITNENGQPVLVSQQLIQQGAAVADISEPNTRFAGWLQSAEKIARAEDTGLWGSCGQATSMESHTLLAMDDRRQS